MTSIRLKLGVFAVSCSVAACSGASTTPTESGTGGATSAGGRADTGGTPSTGNPTTTTGGISATGGTVATSGGITTGGTSTGGTSSTSTATGGSLPANGGNVSTGGSARTGGKAAGGSLSTIGGNVSTGGNAPTGGKATGGNVSTGGLAAAGTSAAGSTAGGNVGAGGSPGTCPSGGWKAGKQTITTQWGGVDRKYVVYIPKNYTGTAPVPLMMVIHGAHNTPALAESWSQMDPISEQNGFIVIYPAGLDCWNVGGTILPGCTAASDDVGFLNNVITEVESHACVDTKRVYVTGISNGSMMAQYMGCHFANIFAAAGGVAAGGGCTPARPLPFFYVLGTADEIVGYDNGANALNWAKRDNCNTTAPVTVYDQGGNTCIVYQGCAASVEVEFCTVTGMRHCWPDNCYQGTSGFQPFQASPLMWEFFSKYSLP